VTWSLPDGRPPRVWQAEAVDAAVRAIRDGRRSVVVAPTGSGKAVAIARLCQMARQPVVVVAPRQALVDQLAETISWFCSGRVGRFYADVKEPAAPIVVACLPSLSALRPAMPRPPGLVILDEVHRAEPYADQINAFGGAVLGFSATPFRSDGPISVVRDVAYRYTYARALSEGVLVPVIPRWNVGDGIDDVDDLVGRFLAGQPGAGVVNASTIADCDAAASRFDLVAIHSRAPRSLLREFREGAFDRVCDVHMLTDGFDAPRIAWLVLRKAALSKLALIQRIGRGVRSFPGKTACVVFDPHGILRLYRLDTPERLGEAIENLGDGSDPRDYAPADIPEMPMSIAISEAEAWSRTMLLMLELAGQDVGRLTCSGRSLPASAREVARLTTPGGSKHPPVWYARYLPEPARETVKRLVALAETAGISSGCASDLLRILTVAKGLAAESASSWVRVKLKKERIAKAKAALEADPDNPDLKRALQDAKAERTGAPIPWAWPNELEVPVIPDDVFRGLERKKGAA